MAPSRNSTDPESDGPDGVTVAVSTTVCPGADGARLAARVVAELAFEMVIVKLVLPLNGPPMAAGLLSVALMSNVKVPALVGVPESTPPGVSVRPAGSAPLEILHV